MPEPIISLICQVIFDLALIAFMAYNSRNSRLEKGELINILDLKDMNIRNLYKDLLSLNKISEEQKIKIHEQITQLIQHETYMQKVYFYEAYIDELQAKGTAEKMFYEDKRKKDLNYLNQILKP